MLTVSFDGDSRSTELRQRNPSMQNDLCITPFSLRRQLNHHLIYDAEAERTLLYSTPFFYTTYASPQPLPCPASALPTLLGIPRRPLAQLALALISFVHFPPCSPRLLSHPLPQSQTSCSDQENGKAVKVMSLDEVELVLKVPAFYTHTGFVWEERDLPNPECNWNDDLTFSPRVLCMLCTTLSGLNLFPVICIKIPLGSWTGTVRTRPTGVICLWGRRLSHAK